MAEDVSETLTQEAVLEVRMDDGGVASIPLPRKGFDIIEQRRAEREGKPPIESQNAVKMEFAMRPPGDKILSLAIEPNTTYEWVVAEPTSRVYKDRFPQAVFIRRITPGEKQELTQQGLQTEPLRKYLTQFVIGQLP